MNGAWSTVASLPAAYNPALYGSAVLADGRLVLVGGQTDAAGASSAVGAIYDPRSDSWQTLAAPADAMANELQCTGKVSTAVLPSGKLLVGAPAFRDLALLDPATLSWTAVSPIGRVDAVNAARKGWTLLPDGSIFALDVADPSGSERLVLSGPSGGSWAAAGNSLQRLHSLARAVDASIQPSGCPANSGSAKRGPALLRPDGTIFAAGADGVTGVFIPPTGGSASRGVWRIGPSTSAPLNFEDSPAALLPNGHVLFGGRPADPDQGSQYFEFDGTSLTSVPAPASAAAAASTELLVLPSGQALFVDGSSQLQVYTPAAAPAYDPAWAPVIANVPPALDGGATYQITGTQFNGLSQASVFRGEQRNATNYPLVRITNNSTGHVFYALTHDHSSMGVATGTSQVTTSFDVPAGIEGGASTLEVVANGIPSAPMAVTITAKTSGLTISTTSLPNGITDIAYSAQLNATGGTPPYSWQITAGRLPFALALNSQTGQITGSTSVQVQDSLLTFQVTDSSSPSQTATTRLALNIGLPLAVTTLSIPNGQTNVPYLAALNATGGIQPYAWTVTSGTLPTGLSLNSLTGIITGTPTQIGSFSITFTVTDGSLPTPQVSTFTVNNWVMSNGTLTCTTTSLPSGIVNNPYSASLTIIGGTAPYTFQLTSGSLPTGISLNTSTGSISGVPTVSVFNSPITLTVADSSTTSPQSITVNLSISIANLLSVTVSSLPNGQANLPYSAQLTAIGGITPYTWQVSQGSLPTGLSLNASTGQITGSPNAILTNAQITFKVTDAGSPVPQTGLAPLTITIVSGPLSIATNSLPDAPVGVPYSATLTAMGGLTPYNWQITTGTLPSGLSLNATTGLISGTPTAPGGLSQLTIKLTDSTTPTAQTKTTQLTLNAFVAPLQITTTSLPNGYVGVPYSATIAATGGIPPYTWSSRRFPGGLAFNSSTGQITGTPTDLLQTILSFTVTDSANPAQTTSTSLNFQITQVVALTIQTTSLPSGVMGSAYSASLTAAGGAAPYTWQLISGTLPTGLSLNTQTGAITGTPTTAGTNLPLTFKVTDSTTPTAQTATANLSLTIVPLGALSITTTSLADGAVGTPYSAPLAASGGATPYTWQLTAGTLPSGLALNTQTGQLTGTPSATVTSTPLTFKVTDSSTPAKTATASLTLTIGQAVTGGPLTITTTSLPAGFVGIPYSATMTASGGTPPYSWSARRLPFGLVLNPNGQITGTPTVTTDQLQSITVTDSTSQSVSANLEIVITVPVGVTITTTSLPAGVINAPYSASLLANGGAQPYTWQLASGSLPAGLTFNAATGQISGTPTAAGQSPTLTFKVTDSSTPTPQTVTSVGMSIMITFGNNTLSITTASLPQGAVNLPYAAPITISGGSGPYTWQLTAGSLPAGLTLNSANGQITGTPTATANNVPLMFKVTDSSSPVQMATASFGLTITPPSTGPLTITTSSLPAGQTNVPYSATLTAVGGISPYTWTTRRMPAGLTLNPNGQITGTPTGPVDQLMLFTVTDSTPGSPQTATVIFEVVVN